MKVAALKTELITAGATELLALLERVINDLEEGSVVAITSKIVSLCESSVIPCDQIDKEELVVRESDLYLPASLSKYGHHFTITNNTLIPMAGVDESNGDGQYVLWPEDAQATANQVRGWAKQRFGLSQIGVIITDSTCHPLRRGTNGIMLAYSGFRALNDYVGRPDLFGRPFTVSQADVAGGLAAAAVLQMGEGAEQTPIAILTELPFVHFQDRDPTAEELAAVIIPLEEDLFAPFLTSVPWRTGTRRQRTEN
ncbi:MAG TPA: coenzyme F420-0:L-glutamate ligase [Streptosporangiaceae bacterium]|jgi:putative folate metabolism gamma-glutamate ligase|nr:coenzyme F420-0:L-glutamate ligase [Streptosporangiaceae bacterium]